MKKVLFILLGMLGIHVNTACSQRSFSDADVSTFASLIKGEGVQLIDVRTTDEYGEGHLEGALNIDYKSDDFKATALATLDKSRPVALYCRSGRRSAAAADILAAEGFTVTNLLGGITAWTKAKMPVTTRTDEIDVFTTPGGKTLRFHALMHASIRIDYDGRQIYIDPVGRLGERTVDYTTLPKANYIFVTHEHGDHFDKDALATLSTADTRLVANKRCAEMLGSGEAMANGDSTALAGDITVEAVPAYNTTEGRTKFHPRGRDNGYIITIDGLRIYVAGDTEDIPEMAHISDIDIAFLPCNQPYTMTTTQLAAAARTIKPRVLFPYHYGQTDVTPLSALLGSEGIEVRIRHYE